MSDADSRRWRPETSSRNRLTRGTIRHEKTARVAEAYGASWNVLCTWCTRVTLAGNQQRKLCDALGNRTKRGCELFRCRWQSSVARISDRTPAESQDFEGSGGLAILETTKPLTRLGKRGWRSGARDPYAGSQPRLGIHSLRKWCWRDTGTGVPGEWIGFP